jgi:hypothetical protein
MVDRPLTNQRSGFRPGGPDAHRSVVGSRRGARVLGAALLLGLVLLAASPPTTTLAAGPPASGPVAVGALAVGVTNPAGGSLESAASRAGDTGRKIGLSLIGLALAVAAVVLVFKRDFKEAVGVIAIGIVAVLLVSPAGINVLRDTVSILFGSS